MYWPYQKPKKCWKCGGGKMWIPESNKWICPICDKPPVYPPPMYPPYGYTPRQRPVYRGPPTPMYQRQQNPMYQPPLMTYQRATPAGNKLCIYCGNTMREDEIICPKCMQKAMVL